MGAGEACGAGAEGGVGREVARAESTAIESAAVVGNGLAERPGCSWETVALGGTHERLVVGECHLDGGAQQARHIPWESHVERDGTVQNPLCESSLSNVDGHHSQGAVVAVDGKEGVAVQQRRRHIDVVRLVPTQSVQNREGQFRNGALDV